MLPAADVLDGAMAAMMARMAPGSGGGPEDPDE
jgi:hypothetical protein